MTDFELGDYVAYDDGDHTRYQGVIVRALRKDGADGFDVLRTVPAPDSAWGAFGKGTTWWAEPRHLIHCDRPAIAAPKPPIVVELAPKQPNTLRDRPPFEGDFVQEITANGHKVGTVYVQGDYAYVTSTGTRVQVR